MASVSGASTQGTEFYFSFIRALPKRTKDMVLLVSAERAGVLEFTSATGTVTTKKFTAGTTSIALASVSSATDEASATITGDLPDCYTVASNQVSNKGYEVESFESDGTTPQKVSLYAGLSGDRTMDVANVYPIEALGNEYYVISHPGMIKDNYQGSSEALVMATEDNTTIEIVPTSILDNQSVTDPLQGVITVTLNKGQTYQLRPYAASHDSVGFNDLTGTVIRTKDDGSLTGNKCKKIAVFAGTQHGYPGDFEYEQLFPTHLWGNEFLVAAPEDGGVDVVRVVASKPCTHVTINGTLVATLNQTDYYDYVDSQSQGCYVQTDKNVGVALFTHPYEGQESKHSNDASMIVLAPIQQKLDSIIFTATYNADASNHRVSIVSPTVSTKNVTLYSLNTSTTKWEPMTLGTWTVVAANANYSTNVVSINPSTTYKIVSTKGGFNAYVYGWGSSKDEYGYSAGSSANIMDGPSFTNVKDSLTMQNFIYNSADGMYHMSSESRTCMGSDVTINTTIPGAFTKIEWDFDASNGITVDTTTDVASVVHRFPTLNAGESKSYTVTMKVYRTATDCYSLSAGNIDIAKAVVDLRAPLGTTSVDTTICKGGSIITHRGESLSTETRPTTYLWYYEDPTTKAAVQITGTNGNTCAIMDDYGTIRKKYWVSTVACNGGVDTFYVTIPAPVTTTYDVNLCKGSTISSTQSASGMTYTWYDASGSVIGKNATLTVPADYGTTATYKVVSEACNSSAETFNVTVPAKSVSNVIVTNNNSHELSFCSDGSTTVIIKGTPTPSTPSDLSWTDGSGKVLTNVNNNIITYNPTQSAVYKMTVIQKDGTGKECDRAIDQVTITAHPTFTASLTAESNDFTTGTTLPMSGGRGTLTVTTQSGNGEYAGPFTYDWTPYGNGDVYNWNLTDKESFQVMVHGGDGLCSATTNVVNIDVNSVDLSDVLIPGSSTNGTFGTYAYDKKAKKYDYGKKLSDILTQGYTITLYNRYGQQIKKTTNDGWDGTMDGHVVDAGTYFYVLEYNTSKGKEDMKGTIDVVKK